MKPLEIRKIEGFGLEIKWSDGLVYRISGKVLRASCPCASCNFERGVDTHSSPLTPKKSPSLKIVSHSAEEANSVARVWAIGQYAIGIAFSDSHDSGIFPFSLLRALAIESGEKICATSGQKCGNCGS